MKHLLLLFTLFLSLQLTAQTLTVKEDGTPIEDSAIAEFQSNSKGILIPRVSSTERENINNPTIGLMLFDTSTERFWFYGSDGWEEIGNGNYDSSYSYDCDNVVNYVFGTDFSSDEACGNLIHNGTADGQDEFSIAGQDNGIYTRIIVNSLNLPAGDTLFLEYDPFSSCIASRNRVALTNTIASPVEFLFVVQCNVDIRLKSVQAIPPSSFDLSWDRLVAIDSVLNNTIGFFYNPIKRAIGGGIERDSAWSKIGSEAILFGNYGTANGDYSISIGQDNEADGESTIAIGRFNDAIGEDAITIGRFNEALEEDAIAIGRRNEATADEALAIGYLNTARDTASIAMGYRTNATANNATAIGTFALASGISSTAVGRSNNARATGASAFGRINSADSLNSTAIGAFNQVEAQYATSVGYNNDIAPSGTFSSAFGYENTPDGSSATALGYSNIADGAFSTAVGYNNTVDGDNASALGWGNTAFATNSLALGRGIVADIYGLTAIGIYNQDVSGSSSSWVEDEPVFMVGNGENLFNRSTALTILKNGDVGIGVNNPADKLEIKGTLRLESAGNSNSYAIRTATDGDIEFVGDGASVHMTINDGNGRVGINTGSPDQLLSVNGNASKSGGGSWSNFSDRRLKKDIKPFTDGLEQVLQIDPITYRYNGKAGIATKDLQIGIIAQDMQKIAPYMVEEADFGAEEVDKNVMNYLVYNPSALDYLFVNAFKEQQAQIEEKDELIEAQNEKIEDLETRLVKLEQLILQSSNTQTIELNATHNTTYLKQNQPNPFSKATLIEYAVPEEVNESKIVFTDLNGSVIKIVAVNGIGQLEITTPNFSTGTYTYSLVIDGKVVTTNKMVLVK